MTIFCLFLNGERLLIFVFLEIAPPTATMCVKFKLFAYFHYAYT